MDLLEKSPKISQTPSEFLAGDENLLIFLDFSWIGRRPAGRPAQKGPPSFAIISLPFAIVHFSRRRHSDEESGERRQNEVSLERSVTARSKEAKTDAKVAEQSREQRLRVPKF